MKKSVASGATVPDGVPSEPGLPFEQAQPLERRRLQAYLALIAGDVLAIFTAFCLSGYLYLASNGLAQAALLAQLLLPVFLTVGLYNGAYSLATLQSSQTGMLRAMSALGISAAAVVFIGYYTKSNATFSRVMFTSGALFALVLLCWTRLQMRAFVRWRCGSRVVNELLIDDAGPQINLPGAMRANAAQLGLVPALHDPAALNRIGTVLNAIDRVVVTCPPERRAAWASVLKSANIAGEVVDDTVAELGAHGARTVGGHGFLRVSIGPLGMRARVTKRMFDTVLAGIALILLIPVLLIVAAAILSEDGSPILFVQRRVGRANRFFEMYKFRSMAAGRSDHEGRQSTERGDARITRVGAFIRRTSLDELPQLFNVLKGEMSNGAGRYFESPVVLYSTRTISRQVSSPTKSASSRGPIGWFKPSRHPLSISAMLAVPCPSTNTASLIIGSKMRLTTNPGSSCAMTTCLPRLSANMRIRAVVSAEVASPGMTSISPITGTGLKK